MDASSLLRSVRPASHSASAASSCAADSCCRRDTCAHSPSERRISAHKVSAMDRWTALAACSRVSAASLAAVASRSAVARSAKRRVALSSWERRLGMPVLPVAEAYRDGTITDLPRLATGASVFVRSASGMRGGRPRGSPRTRVQRTRARASRSEEKTGRPLRFRVEFRVFFTLTFWRREHLFSNLKLIRGYAGSSLGRRVFERWSSSDRNALKASGAWPR